MFRLNHDQPALLNPDSTETETHRCGDLWGVAGSRISLPPPPSPPSWQRAAWAPAGSGQGRRKCHRCAASIQAQPLPSPQGTARGGPHLVWNRDPQCDHPSQEQEGASHVSDQLLKAQTTCVHFLAPPTAARWSQLRPLSFPIWALGVRAHGPFSGLK